MYHCKTGHICSEIPEMIKIGFEAVLNDAGSVLKTFTESCGLVHTY